MDKPTVVRCGIDKCRHPYVSILLACPKCGNLTRKLPVDDPARIVLGLAPTKPVVYRDGCYICEDSEFAQLGMPLCRACEFCADGHVPADDCVCDRCGKDERDGVANDG